jgi:4-hydroxyphenylpyruvate dioxygenase
MMIDLDIFAKKTQITCAPSERPAPTTTIATEFSEPETVMTMATTHPLRLNGIAYVEVYVANAYQSAFFYRSALGFAPVAMTTPGGDATSVLMKQGDIRLLLTSGTTSDSPVARHVHAHGDTVRDVAFLVDDVAAAFSSAMARGARAVAEPTIIRDDASDSAMVRATIGAPGDTVHSFVQFSDSVDHIWPAFRAISLGRPCQDIGLTEVDHVAVGLDAGSLDHWVDFYKSVLGFRQSHSEMIFTSRSGMNSKVVEDDSAVIRIPMVEPAGQTGNSQIDEYLTYHQGAGAQHVAFATSDIAAAIETLSARGVRCLSIPQTYYDDLETRVPDLNARERARFAAAGVLVDREDHGLLLQSFTEPVHHRPTMFLELIERRGARGFGGRNIQALFEAVERDRIRREAEAATAVPA